MHMSMRGGGMHKRWALQKKSMQVGTGWQQHVCNLNVDAKIF